MSAARRRGARFALASWLCAMLTVVLSTPAQAHDWLTHSNPAAGGTVMQAPAKIALTFDDIVLTEPAGPQVAVIGTDGKHDETGCASAVGRDVSVPWTPGRPGRYRVEWRIVSADGHPVSNSIEFTYAGAPGANGGRDAGFSCAGSSSAAAGSSAAPAERSSSRGSSAPVIVGAVAGVVALAAIVVMMTRGRRPRVDDDADESEDD